MPLRRQARDIAGFGLADDVVGQPGQGGPPLAAPMRVGAALRIGHQDGAEPIDVKIALRPRRRQGFRRQRVPARMDDAARRIVDGRPVQLENGSQAAPVARRDAMQFRLDVVDDHRHAVAVENGRHHHRHRLAGAGRRDAESRQGFRQFQPAVAPAPQHHHEAMNQFHAAHIPGIRPAGRAVDGIDGLVRIERRGERQAGQGERWRQQQRCRQLPMREAAHHPLTISFEPIGRMLGQAGEIAPDPVEGGDADAAVGQIGQRNRQRQGRQQQRHREKRRAGLPAPIACRPVRHRPAPWRRERVCRWR